LAPVLPGIVAQTFFLHKIALDRNGLLYRAVKSGGESGRRLLAVVHDHRPRQLRLTVCNKMRRKSPAAGEEQQTGELLAIHLTLEGLHTGGFSCMRSRIFLIPAQWNGFLIDSKEWKVYSNCIIMWCYGGDERWNPGSL
jgi:hypothetical protein